ncbi:DUF3500 domain-containing protein [Flavihumibacter fluvii]|uniref:DUF3500 domain-containing protein n=1 Tax=Flavihumibacter fluvii TaxID=2838157 RepID=UPI001BDEAA33|nr:DUF3500 domain-containing protein [Flavihumibacter fluvii]ULQ52977.1 DUF3500 domain-containing protein [Flavihumibacter fluvii]
MKFIPAIFAIILCLAIEQSNAQMGYNEEIKQSAIQFVNTLDPSQKKLALLSFEDSARTKWNNLPVGLRPRAGINIGKMTEDQRKLFHRILSVTLSSQGYLKATSILHLDNLLNLYYDSLYYKKAIDDTMHKFLQDLQWSHRNFYLAFFGNPTGQIWGFKIEGHHLSINFSFVNDKLSVTPFFIGTDPAEYPNSEYAGWRVLGQEEDLGIKLMSSLSPALQQKATISKEVPGDIFTSAESGKRLLDFQGIKGAEMSKEQKAIALYIIREFVFNMEYDKALVEYDKIIKAGIDKIYFGWIGPVQEKEPHYYVLNGPTFLIELDNQGFMGNANHIHAIWREKGNEYGEDVLKKHYLSEKH